MIVHRSRFLTQGEVWFEEEPDNTSAVDWIIYHRRPRPVPGVKWRYTYTYAVNLERSVEEMKAQLNTDNAYKIRRACERDKIQCETPDPRDPAVLDQFQAMYNAFAAIKGLQPLPRGRVDSMAAAGRLDLSVAKDSQGNVLVYHGNYRMPHRATSLYTVSLFRTMDDSSVRNFIGRANRYLVWSDLLRYREEGLSWFDFGGWYCGTDPGMLKINEFKRGFGGETVQEYHCERIVSLKGWVVLSVAKLLNWGKKVSDNFRPAKQPSAGVTVSVADPAGSSRPIAEANRRALREPQLAK